eukprot:tig00000821_g4521.t1
MSGKPKHWPDGVRWIVEYIWDSRVSAEERAKHAPSRKPDRPYSSSSSVAAKRIDAPGHPAHGQIGLFAARTLDPGEHVCDYVGVVTRWDDADESSNYLMPYGPGLLCDASRELEGNEGRFVNDFHGIAAAPNVRHKPYTAATGETRLGFFVLKRKIPKGTELLTEYGRGFNLGGH